MALVVAGVAPVLLGCGALAVDFAGAFSMRSALQSAADGAALAAARELPLRSTSSTIVDSIVRGYVRQNLNRDIRLRSLANSILDDRNGVRVELSAHAGSIMGGLINPEGFNPRVIAVARLSNGTPLCALALETRAPGGIQLVNQAHLSAPNCAVASNSTSENGIMADNNSEIRAAMICSSGGAHGMGSNYDPEPITDCPPIDIPSPIARSPTRAAAIMSLSCACQGRCACSQASIAAASWCCRARLRGSIRASM